MVSVPPLAFVLGIAPDAPWPSIIIASSIVGGLVFAIGAITLLFKLRQARPSVPANEPGPDGSS